MELTDAIYKRRAVRTYTAQKVDRASINALMDAAVQAPSAMNTQPWAFAVIQDAALLKRYSDSAKTHFLKTFDLESIGEEVRKMLTDPDFNMFYDAATLIIICAKSAEQSAAEDCCLAAQNLMLAACSQGLGTCPIGFARSWLNLPEAKQELGIPAEYVPVLPIIVGYPRLTTPHVPRKAPDILFWK